MASRLSSLLVRDGLVKVHRMEHVFQRQVIYGGSLDTILLEMRLIDDGRLQQYLSLATGLPNSVSSEGADGEKLREVCNKDMATKYRVVPAKHDGGALSVLVCDPVENDVLESLADELDMRVHPMVVPEYEFRMRFVQLFGGEADKRFSELAKHRSTDVVASVAKQVPIVTIGEASSSEHDVDAEDAFHAPPSAADTSVDAVPMAIEPESTKAADTSERVRGTRAPAEQPERRQTEETPVVEVPVVEVPVAETGEASEPVPVTTPPVVEASPYSSISPDEARHLLDTCEDRDEIFVILLRAIRKRARHACLFTLKGNNAVGRVALSKEGVDNEDIRNISISLSTPSRFQQAFKSKAFSVGSLDTDNEELSTALSALGGGTPPTSALLLPIVMRDRVIAIAVGHNRDRGISVGRVTELLPLGTATADAVNRLLARMRSAKGKPQPAQPTTTNEEERKTEVMMVPPVHIDTDDGAPSAIPTPNEAMTELFARVEDNDQKISNAAIAEALKAPDQAVGHLHFAFPGTLVHARQETKHLSAAEYGPVLDLVVQLGAQCGPIIAEKMRDADREVRYYATLCALEIRPDDVIDELVERLFDGDEGIRALAVQALNGYPREPLHAALDFARKALHSEDNPRVKVAADGLTQLGDTSAIPDLIDAHSRGGDAAEVSRHALFLLTNQSFGNSNRKWRSWWEKHKETHRIEWMLEGLSHKNAETRKNASEILRSLTGEFFGYGHDLPKKERERTRKLWLEWWKKTGQDIAR